MTTKERLATSLEILRKLQENKGTSIIKSDEYMASLEKASVEEDISDFANFVFRLILEQSNIEI